MFYFRRAAESAVAAVARSPSSPTVMANAFIQQQREQSADARNLINQMEAMQNQQQQQQQQQQQEQKVKRCVFFRVNIFFVFCETVLLSPIPVFISLM